MRDNFKDLTGAVPEYITIEKKQFDCPNCNRPFYVAKMPDWMGSDFHEDMSKEKDKQLRFLHKKLRAFEQSVELIMGRPAREAILRKVEFLMKKEI